MKKRQSIAIYSLSVLIIVLTSGFAYQKIAEIRDAKQHPPVGLLVNVDSTNIHVHASGSGKPTVVLIAGAGDIEAVWEPVQQSLSAIATVVSYDRPGLGYSDFYSGNDLTLEKQAELLYQALQKSGHQAPYILVGHSLGGLITRHFAQQYPKDISGVVLVDSSVEGQFSQLPEEILAANNSAANVFAIAGRVAKLGVHRLAGMGTSKAKSFQALSKSAQIRIANTLHQSRAFNALQRDGAVANAAMEYGKPFAAKALGNTPLIVITRGLAEDAVNPSHPYSNAEKQMFATAQTVWMKLQQGLLVLSDNSQQRIAAKSGHYIHTTEPQVVVDAVKSILKTAPLNSKERHK